MATYSQLNTYNKKHLALDRFTLLIKSGSDVGEVFPTSISVDMGRQGSPSKLTATIVDDGMMKIEEGSTVNLMVDGKRFWYGYIFKINSSKAETIEVLAYDQLRYLKNRDTYQYENTTYAGLLQMICFDHGLAIGEIEDTGFPIAGRIEEDKPYWDMLEVANQMTVAYTGKVFVLYDDAGKICLKSLDSMKLSEPVIEAGVIEDYNYESNIDDNTYNRIKIDLIDEENNVVKPVVVEDAGNIAKWGTLQYYVQTTEKDGVERKAQILLDTLNRVLRKLEVSNAFGDVNVRAGSVIPVSLRLRDLAISGYMMVESITHKFENEYHFMDMRLHNKDFQFETNPDGFFKKEQKAKSNSGGTSGGTSGGFSGMTGDTIQEKIWSFFKSQGYSNEAISAIMGNIYAESGYRTDAVNPNGGAFGLVQWLGTRKDALYNYAQSKGTSPSDLKTQLEFIHKELMEMAGGADFAKSTKDVATLTRWFMDRYERPSEAEKAQSIGTRLDGANKAFNSYKNWNPTPAMSSKRQGFIDYVTAQVGTEYDQARRMQPGVYDCSSLVWRGMKDVGLDSTGEWFTTHNLARGDSRFTEISKSQLAPGDILYTEGHVAIFLGGNKTMEAFDWGKPNGYGQMNNRFNRYFRINGIDG